MTLNKGGGGEITFWTKQSHELEQRRRMRRNHVLE
jgi:hypothetical protein